MEREEMRISFMESQRLHLEQVRLHEESKRRYLRATQRFNNEVAMVQVQLQAEVLRQFLAWRIASEETARIAKTGSLDNTASIWL